VLIATIVGLNFLMVPKQTLLMLYFLFGSLFLFCLQFFRNPTVTVTQNPKHVLAPADGKVVVIEETEETEYLNEARIQISIFMSPINKHINRNPVSGTIKYLKYHAGKYLVAWHPKASTDNERTTIVYELPGGLQILIRQIAGAMARRIKYYIGMNDSVEQGEEFGFIKFGSRVDVFLPTDAKILVEKDQKTEGGITVLAELL
jgi:phosphatidylserine decarboxylase